MQRRPLRCLWAHPEKSGVGVGTVWKRGETRQARRRAMGPMDWEAASLSGVQAFPANKANLRLGGKRDLGSAGGEPNNWARCPDKLPPGIWLEPASQRSTLNEHRCNRHCVMARSRIWASNGTLFDRFRRNFGRRPLRTWGRPPRSTLSRPSPELGPRRSQLLATTPSPSSLELDQNWLLSTAFGSISNRICRCRPDVGRCQPELADFDQAWSISANFAPMPTNSGPTLARLVVDFAQSWAVFDQIRAVFGQLLAEFDQSMAEIGWSHSTGARRRPVVDGGAVGERASREGLAECSWAGGGAAVVLGGRTHACMRARTHACTRSRRTRRDRQFEPRHVPNTSGRTLPMSWGWAKFAAASANLGPSSTVGPSSTRIGRVQPTLSRMPSSWSD